MSTAAISRADRPNPGVWIGRIGAKILGFRRDSHHSISVETASRVAQWAPACGSACLADADISAKGHVGPLAVTPGADAKEVVRAVVRWGAFEGSADRFRWSSPGRGARILGAMSELGFRNNRTIFSSCCRPGHSATGAAICRAIPAICDAELAPGPALRRHPRLAKAFEKSLAVGRPREGAVEPRVRSRLSPAYAAIIDSNAVRAASLRPNCPFAAAKKA